MSRSRKKAIFKQGSGKNRKLCRRTVKKSQRMFLKNNLDDIIEGKKVIPDGRSIVNDYDYCDYVSDCEHIKRPNYYSNIVDRDELRERLSRK